MSEYSPTDLSPEASAVRNVPNNPRPLCREFTPNTAPWAAYWCANCRWNKDLHDSETYRAAVAAELERMAEKQVAS